MPNSGVATQPDLNLFGLHYLQQVSDANPPPFSTAGQALHIVPGFFMNVPASTVPENPASIVRLASIPHGVSLLFQGPAPSATPVPGPPDIPPIFPIPELPAFAPTAGALGLGIQPTDVPPPGGDGAEHIVPEVDVANDVAGSQSNRPYPAEFQGFINDPKSVLRAAIADQEIVGTITLELSTENVANSIGNIPFLGIPNPAQAQNPTTPNAFVSSARATFWIEWVRIHNLHSGNKPPTPPGHHNGGQGPFPGQPTFLQLQYSQLSILIFNNVLWPHINTQRLSKAVSRGAARERQRRHVSSTPRSCCAAFPGGAVAQPRLSGQRQPDPSEPADTRVHGEVVSTGTEKGASFRKRKVLHPAPVETMRVEGWCGGFSRSEP